MQYHWVNCYCCKIGLWQRGRREAKVTKTSVRGARGQQVLNKVDLLRGSEVERLQAWLLDSSGASAVIPTSATQARPHSLHCQVPCLCLLTVRLTLLL